MNLKNIPMFAMLFLALISISIISYQLGRIANMNDQIKLLENKIETVLPVEPVEPVNIDKQCVAWMFQSNLKDVKKHICGGKK